MTEQEFAEHVLRMQLDGYTVLPNIFTEEECDEARVRTVRLLLEKSLDLVREIVEKLEYGLHAVHWGQRGFLPDC